jgi:hypothetical protein
MVKVTFSLDEATVDRLKTTSARLGIPQSQVVREAVADYAARAGRLSEAERREMLRAIDRLLPQVPGRPDRDTDRELRAIRTARRGGGRRHPGR